jgi:hypothetical protein
MRFAALMIALVLMLSLVNSTMAAPVEYGEENINQPSSSLQVSFTDLPNTHWAYKYIADMVNRKVIGGYPDNKFRPNNTISRAEFATIIIKAAGLQATKVNYSSFSDIKVTDWYSPFVETAKDYLTGYRVANGQYIFNPAAPALREDITIAIVKLKGYDVARLSNRSTIEAMFKDYEGISESAKDYVSIAVENGLVSGYQDETFRPQNSITRAEAAALLWRAFMYGNDNKGVGGDSGATTGITPPVKQPDGQPAPQPTTQPSQNQNAAKFSVDTLVGGIGQGDVDGPVNKAKINQVDSMVVDKDNNVYFLDGDLRKVRKFNSSTGSVETFKTIDKDFNWDYSKDGTKITHYDYAQFKPSILSYNDASDKLYLLGKGKVEYYKNFVYEIKPTVQMAVYNFQGRMYPKFLNFNNDNSIIYGAAPDKYYGSDSAIFEAQLASEANIFASSKDRTGVEFSSPRYESDPIYPTKAIILNNEIFTFDTSLRTLSKIQLFPRKVETIAVFDKIGFESVSTYNGKFYVSSGATIYELNTEGKLSIYIDGKDLTYNDGSKINEIKHFTFDSLGNIILYDDNSKSIRRINL